MANALFSFWLAIALIAFPVLAGNRAWEPSNRHTMEVKSLRDPAVLTGQNKTTSRRSVSAKSDKRWMTIKPGSNDADAKIWPNHQITYCFENTAARDATFDDLKEAKQLWYDTGLSEAFKWTQGSDAFCANTANRSKYLLIMYNTVGRLGTSVGLPPLRDGVNAGPLMRLSDSTEVGMMNVVANYAHEMGHAWGLHHEHQNQRFWGGEDYSESGGTYWGDQRWNCKNLKDYDRILAEQIAAWGTAIGTNKMNSACKNRRRAMQLEFSAHDYLPITDEAVSASSKTEPDWDSIMIYPSGAGAVGPSTGGVDGRSSILLKPDGSRIEKVYKPSQKDIKGLTDLYGGVLAAKLTLLGDKASAAKAKFDKMRKSEPDSGCAAPPTKRRKT